MSIGLTGSPRISGVLYAGQSAVSGRLVDESVTSERRGGLVVVLEQRYRAEGEVTWSALSEAEALGLQSDIGQVCDLDLRTRDAGDPAWATELTLRVLRTSKAKLTESLGGVDSVTGRPVWEVSFEWRSLRTYTLVELGLGPIGGFYLTGSS